MAATITLHLLSFLPSNLTSPTMDFHSKLTQPTLSLAFFFLSTFSVFSFLILVFSFIHRRYRRIEQRSSNSTIQCSLLDSVATNQPADKSNLTQLTHSLLFEILPSNSLKSETVFKYEACDDPVGNGSDWDRETVDLGGEERGKKKKKKRAKKKRHCSPNPKVTEECAVKEGLGVKGKQELVCLYPYTSSSSATQRKIKQQYDQLVKSHESNCLTLAQVGQFVHCLIEARNELQHKSEVIQRKFTITKALLLKADRSSFDRLSQQIYKLELEHKRLEEDVFVYNWLQQQLKLSPAYKRMLEIGASIELKAKSGELVKSSDTEFADISFEELLAQEKKDSFWQRNGKLRSCLG